MSKNLFVIGTGTEVGKTYLSALLVKKLQESGRSVGYFKAAMSGNERDAMGHLIPGDGQQVKQISGIPQAVEEMCPYVYERAVSPHLAAKMEGRQVETAQIAQSWQRVSSAYEYVTLEGSGGILCPLRMEEERQLWLEDVIRMTQAPCLLVADAGLGCINAVGLTAFYLKEKQIPLKGILLNRFRAGDAMYEDNRRQCEAVAGVPVLACVAEGAKELPLSAEAVASLYEGGRTE